MTLLRINILIYLSNCVKWNWTVNHDKPFQENKYPHIISNSLGKLKNHNIQLYIDHSIPLIARMHYRIPFHLGSKVIDF